MQPDAQGGVRLEFSIPARMLMGYRSEFLTDTKGNGIMSHVFDGYAPWKGVAPVRARGSIIAHETGVTTGYGLFGAQDRGRMFVGPGVEVYEGMVVGENARAEDIVVNVCRKKHVTNMRASGSDESLRLTPPVLLSLEQTMEFIADDELMEVTPNSIRMRKRILNKERRYKNDK
jgi:GTP-binding protein